MSKPIVDYNDKTFGVILNCAVRYALGRRTYIPSLVIEFIIPLLPSLDRETLRNFLTSIEYTDCLGDEIDELYWMTFRQKIKDELNSRQ